MFWPINHDVLRRETGQQRSTHANQKEKDSEQQASRCSERRRRNTNAGNKEGLQNDHHKSEQAEPASKAGVIVPCDQSIVVAEPFRVATDEREHIIM